MIRDWLGVEIDKRKMNNKKVVDAFFKHFKITNNRQDKMRRIDVQTVIMRELGFEWNAKACTQVNIILKQIGVQESNNQGLRYFRGLRLLSHNTGHLPQNDGAKIEEK